ncbi:ABC transporter ATP-binding protein [Salipiger sp.]|uniref:ABC transporter ATP-binding protein n=1 Tax=Salipiger sp. TaxID=2078585 RepID=UPI003A9820C6
MMAVPFLECRGVEKHFPVTRGIIRDRAVGWVKAVDGINLSIGAGKTLAIVGESGCGKSTTAKLILQMERPTGGDILWQGKPLATLGRDEAREYRRSVQAVFQDPYSSLNPRMRVGAILAEPMTAFERPSGAEVRTRTATLLAEVGLPAGLADLFPHELSGGQRQRVAIARALASKPKMIVLDEPVSALDVSVRAQVMNLLKDLQPKFGLTYLLIAHQLGTIRYMADHVVVMYLGKVVEDAPCEELFTRPRHPYTQALLAASLPAHPAARKEKTVLDGEIPSPLNPPPGCAFHTRCPLAMDRCGTESPALQGAEGHRTACHLARTDARQMEPELG